MESHHQLMGVLSIRPCSGDQLTASAVGADQLPSRPTRSVCLYLDVLRRSGARRSPAVRQHISAAGVRQHRRRRRLIAILQCYLPAHATDSPRPAVLQPGLSDLIARRNRLVSVARSVRHEVCLRSPTAATPGLCRVYHGTSAAGVYCRKFGRRSTAVARDCRTVVACVVDLTCTVNRPNLWIVAVVWLSFVVKWRCRRWK